MDKIVLKTREVIYKDTFKVFDPDTFDAYVGNLFGYLASIFSDRVVHNFDGSKISSILKDFQKYNCNDKIAEYLILSSLTWDDVTDAVVDKKGFMTPTYKEYVLYCVENHIPCGNMYDYIRRTFLANGDPLNSNSSKEQTTASEEKEKCEFFPDEYEDEYKEYIKNFENNLSL